jgi:hypothetical protein
MRPVGVAAMGDSHHRHDVLLVIDRVQRAVLPTPRASQLLHRRVELLAQPVRILGHRPGQVLEQCTGRRCGSRFIPRQAAAVKTTV